MSKETKHARGQVSFSLINLPPATHSIFFWHISLVDILWNPGGGGWGWGTTNLTPQGILLKLMTVQVVHCSLRSLNLREALAFLGSWVLEPGPKDATWAQSPGHHSHTRRVPLSATLNLPRTVSRGKEGTHNPSKCGLQCRCDLLGSPVQGKVAHFGQ